MEAEGALGRDVENYFRGKDMNARERLGAQKLAYELAIDGMGGRVNSEFAHPPSGLDLVLRHRQRRREALEEPLGARGERPQVPGAGEQRVDQRVLSGDDLHEEPVVQRERGGEPIVGL
jgi:hypothetical protein